MKPFRGVTLCLLLLSLLAACKAENETLPLSAPSIRGIVGRWDPNEPTTLLVEGYLSGNPSQSTKAMVRLTDDTRLMRPLGEGALRSAPKDLAVGQTVSVWFLGPVKESYPLQADAQTIVIESDPQP